MSLSNFTLNSFLRDYEVLDQPDLCWR